MARKAAAVIEQEAEQRDLSSVLSALHEATNNSIPGSVQYMVGQTGRWSSDKAFSSGVLAVDMATGIGGWPKGRLIEIYGQESSGKTTLCLHSVREAQKAGIPVLFIDAENALDLGYFEKLGGDPKRLLVNQPSSLQNAQDLMAYWMENVMELSPENGSVIVLDSIPALAPQQVIDASAEKETRALAARFWSAQLPRLVPLMAKSKTTVFMINQMRDGMDMYTPATTPGGKAIKFNASIRCEVKRKRPEGAKDEGGSTGQETNVVLVKNKVGSPFRKANYFLPSGAPVDPEQDVIDTAIFYGVIESDTKFENGEGFDKKNWYAYVIGESDRKELRKQRLAAFKKAGGKKEDFTFEFEDDNILQGYHMKGFLAKLDEWPELIPIIREEILESLNAGDAETDEDMIEDMTSDIDLEKNLGDVDEDDDEEDDD